MPGSVWLAAAAVMTVEPVSFISATAAMYSLSRAVISRVLSPPRDTFLMTGSVLSMVTGVVRYAPSPSASQSV